MVLNSFKKKCDDISHDGTGWGVYVSEDNVAFPPSKERYDITHTITILTICHLNKNFITTKMSGITLQHIG
jgi:hypothetical protein